MQNNRGKFLSVIGLFLIFILPQKHITIYLAGDSTMCDFEKARSPLTGWGTPFSSFFDSSVTVINKARGGRSTKTFISENRWQSIIDNLREGDYVFIQFGHNDETKEERFRDRQTPIPDYKINLERFIREARAKKAFPVLITPVTRMEFDSSGGVPETHPGYSTACIEVALKNKVPLIDLDKKSRELVRLYGPDRAKYLILLLETGANHHYPTGIDDSTHFNEYGARIMAEQVLAGIRELKLDLVERIYKPKVDD